MSRSWSVPAKRSTRPLACGERAKTWVIPSSSSTRANCTVFESARSYRRRLEDAVAVRVARERQAAAQDDLLRE